MKGKQLRKAVLLGMAMSMAVWTTGMAENITGPITDESYNKEYNEEVTVTNDDPMQAAIQVANKEVTISTGDKFDIQLNSYGSGIRTGNEDSDTSTKSTVEVISSGNNIIQFNMESGSEGNGITVEDNSNVTVIATGENHIFSENPSPKVGDGIRIAGNGTASITGQYNTISVGDDGLYLSRKNGNDATITLTATGANADGIGNYLEGNNGIHTDGAGTIYVTASNGKNVILGKENAVHASGSATINIIASGNPTGEGISLLADHTGVDNIFIAGENGVISDGTGETNFIAANDNIIAGTTNGILSSTEGTINVTAGHDNIIGQYTDKNQTITSNVGINVSAGTVTINSTNDTSVFGNKNAINSTGGTVSITAENANLKASGSSKEETIYNKDGEITITANTDVNISSIAKNNQSNGLVNDNGQVTVNGKNISITAEGMMAQGISNNNGGNVSLTANSNVNIKVNGTFSAYGSYNDGSAFTDITNTEGITQIIANGQQSDGIGVLLKADKGKVGNTEINSKLGNIIQASHYAVKTGGMDGGFIKITTADGSNILEAVEKEAINANGGAVELTAAMSNHVISDKSSAIFANGSSSNVTLTGGENNIIAATNGIDATINSKVSLTANNGNNMIFAHGTGINVTNDSKARNTAEVILQSNQDNEIYSKGIGIKTEGTKTLADTAAKVSLHGGNNRLYTEQSAIEADVRSTVELKANTQDNNIYAGTLLGVIYGEEDAITFGSAEAVRALNGSTVTLEAGLDNSLSGAVYGSGENTTVIVNGLEETASKKNEVYSSAFIDNAGGLKDDKNPDSDASFKDKSVVSALYAEHGAAIQMTGEQNIIRTYADSSQEDTILERAVWAYEGSDITIDGSTLISTDSYDLSHNSADIAIAAGTAVNLEEEDFNTPIEDGARAKVTLNYGAGSSITGDVLSAYAGKVDIAPQATTTRSNSAGISITGNLLAGNNGILNVNLGNGGSLVGRTDDYGDANDTIVNDAHIQFFNPAFSSTIYRGGEVNLTMGSGSYWDVTGQSWLTRLDGDGGTIDMRNSENEKTTSHAVHVDTITGNHTFVMDLNHDNHNVSDMLYIKDPNASAGEQTIFINRLTGVEDMADGEKLRFATVNASTDKLSFVGQYEGENGYGNKARVMMRDIGVMDMALTIENEKYTTADMENTGYNGTDFTETKPGDEYVDETYTNGTNWYLTRTSSGDTTSDAGKTVVAMSRINYSNAVYMDRLNKRMGEARYIDGDEGLWVRMRHDRIGKSDAFRSMNTMMELGYDTRVNDREDGEHRQGVAIDYMRGTADYKNVAGEGDVRRGGIWFYDTWLGNKGHYTDYVLKFGRLSNDFEIYARSTGEKITGDYSNFVYSASAEYGRKKDLGSNWYIEPQAQIQYAHVTDADYTTSQDTQVQLDAIDSLIGRVGFRLGKDVGEKSTFYIKADVLHEFLGDQDIEARDATGLLSTTYENEGTWYDIGLGFSHQFNKGTYMFLDVEKTFGNDNEDTYQFNVGMNWKV
jgi:outer membrane autotransporter protein